MTKSILTPGGDTTLYAYDGGQVVAEFVTSNNGSSTTTLARSFVYGLYIDEPLALIDETTSTPTYYYYVRDHRASLIGLLNDGGSFVELYTYTAFGKMTVLRPGADGQWDQGADDILATESAYANPYGFTGRRWDAEIGLWYYRNRMYSAELGRFLQRDPLGYIDGYNMYAYVGNRPFFSLDPSGLFLEGIFGDGNLAPMLQQDIVGFQMGQFIRAGRQGSTNARQPSILRSAVRGGDDGAAVALNSMTLRQIDFFRTRADRSQYEAIRTDDTLALAGFGAAQAGVHGWQAVAIASGFGAVMEAAAGGIGLTATSANIINYGINPIVQTMVLNGTIRSGVNAVNYVEKGNITESVTSISDVLLGVSFYTSGLVNTPASAGINTQPISYVYKPPTTGQGRPGKIISAHGGISTMEFKSGGSVTVAQNTSFTIMTRPGGRLPNEIAVNVERGLVTLPPGMKTTNGQINVKTQAIYDAITGRPGQRIPGARTVLSGSIVENTVFAKIKPGEMYVHEGPRVVTPETFTRLSDYNLPNSGNITVNTCQSCLNFNMYGGPMARSSGSYVGDILNGIGNTLGSISNGSGSSSSRASLPSNTGGARSATFVSHGF